MHWGCISHANSDGTYDIPAQPVRVRLDIRDDATPEQIGQVVNVVRAAVARERMLPADRSALGRPIPPARHRVYEMQPPAAALENLMAGLERLDVLEEVTLPYHKSRCPLPLRQPNVCDTLPANRASGLKGALPQFCGMHDGRFSAVF